ncbi:MAG TPA: hypothetical protein PLJ47_10950 [Candidatus Hydrogenedentes bacterium]|nr:hypothetical protein [Candidatus Hydrogenedentota bacterium]
MRARFLVFCLPLCLWLTGNGCAFFGVQREAVPNIANTPIDWTVLDAIAAQDGLVRVGFEELYDSIEDDLSFYSPLRAEHTEGKPWSKPLIRFFHISDAQIRDERIHREFKERWQLKIADKVIGVSKRNPYVDSYDTLTFASFIIAGKKKIAVEGEGFIAFTGDMLDISTSTEMIEAMNVLRAVEEADKNNQRNFYSIPGNHDGLIFGNVSDYLSFMWNLGISRTEFVLGHMAVGMEMGTPTPYGFGYEHNEIIKHAGSILAKIGTRQENWDKGGNDDASSPLAQIAGLKRMDYVRWHCEDIQAVLRYPLEARFMQSAESVKLNSESDAVQLRELETQRLSNPTRVPITVPGAYRQSVRVRENAEIGLQTGYYSWCAPLLEEITGISQVRYISLDTRSHLWSGGDIDAVQLLWLYRELVEANANREVVVFFAHHSPGKISANNESRKAMKRLLAAFPNVIGYFYGHSHWNEVDNDRKEYDVPLIQTGSMADFPQMGRWINIYADENAVSDGVRFRISWNFARPSFREDSGIPVHMMLDASRIDSRKEHQQKTRFPRSPIKRMNDCNCEKSDSPPDWERFIYECLRPGYLDTDVRFIAEPPSPERLLGEPLYREGVAWREWLGLDDFPADRHAS